MNERRFDTNKCAICKKRIVLTRETAISIGITPDDPRPLGVAHQRCEADLIAKGEKPKASKKRKMPQQNRHESNQIVATPDDFLEAVERRFGAISFDLAAIADNSVAGDQFYGPGSIFAQDSLAPSTMWPSEGLLWLNPEFKDITLWAKKCAEWRLQTARNPDPCGALLLMLVPYSAGTDWWIDHVAPNADQIAVGRVKFVGHRDWYPKDLALCVFDPVRVGIPTVSASWKWREPWP